jgi:hypothetical protein
VLLLGVERARPDLTPGRITNRLFAAPPAKRSAGAIGLLDRSECRFLLPKLLMAVVNVIAVCMNSKLKTISTIQLQDLLDRGLLDVVVETPEIHLAKVPLWWICSGEVHGRPQCFQFLKGTWLAG